MQSTELWQRHITWYVETFHDVYCTIHVLGGISIRTNCDMTCFSTDSSTFCCSCYSKRFCDFQVINAIEHLRFSSQVNRYSNSRVWSNIQTCVSYFVPRARFPLVILPLLPSSPTPFIFQSLSLPLSLGRVPVKRLSSC